MWAAGFTISTLITISNPLYLLYNLYYIHSTISPITNISTLISVLVFLYCLHSNISLTALV